LGTDDARLATGPLVRADSPPAACHSQARATFPRPQPRLLRGILS